MIIIGDEKYKEALEKIYHNMDVKSDDPVFEEIRTLSDQVEAYENVFHQIEQRTDRQRMEDMVRYITNMHEDSVERTAYVDTMMEGFENYKTIKRNERFNRSSPTKKK